MNEKELKEFIKNNLKIDISISDEHNNYGKRISVNVALEFDGEIISNASDYYDVDGSTLCH